MNRGELRKYADAEGAELGEAVRALLDLEAYKPFLGDRFKRALIYELKDHLDNFKDHARIVTHTETVERTFTELEWD